MPSLCLCTNCHLVIQQPRRSKLYATVRTYYWCDKADKRVAMGDSTRKYAGRRTPEWCPREGNNGNSDYSAADN